MKTLELTDDQVKLLQDVIVVINGNLQPNPTDEARAQLVKIAKMLRDEA